MKALITGASSGIGEEIAKYLDELGYETILVARRKERLEEISSKMRHKSTYYCLDLGKEANVFKLIDELKDVDIDVLINNAGFGLFGKFQDTSLERELEMIDLNIKTLHILTKEFIRRFTERKAGYILNVASSAGFLAGPNLSTYYATKNYVVRLTEAIYEELRKDKSNVHISALCPGPVDTEFNKVAKGTFASLGISPTKVAHIAVDGLFKKKLIIFPGLKMKLAHFFMRFVPDKVLLKIIYKYQNNKLKK